jgi:hypothetical protein
MTPIFVRLAYLLIIAPVAGEQGDGKPYRQRSVLVLESEASSVSRRWSVVVAITTQVLLELVDGI